MWDYSGFGEQTVPGRVLGTPLYMAPEQWRGDAIDHRVDLYAAALILYELVAGQRPFRGSDITEVMIQTTTKAPPSLIETHSRYPIPAELDGVVMRGLAKDPDERYATATEMPSRSRSRSGTQLLPSRIFSNSVTHQP